MVDGRVRGNHPPGGGCGQPEVMRGPGQRINPLFSFWVPATLQLDFGCFVRLMFIANAGR